MKKINLPIIKEAFKYLGWVLLFAALWFNGCSHNAPVPQIAKVNVPETKGSFEPKKPINIPIVINANKTTNALTCKENLQVENPINQKLIEENEQLKVEYKIATAQIKDTIFKKVVQLNKFSSTFENDKLILNIDGIVQGEVKEITPSYIWKKQTVEVPIKNKETVFRLLGGLEIGNNISLSNPIFKANLGVQNRKGNIITGSYDSNKNIYVGYQFSIFNIKG